MWSGGRRTKIQTTSRPDHVWPDAWTRIGKSPSKTREARMGDRETKTPETLRRIGSIDPNQDCKDIIKNARRKFETPMAPAMPRKREFSKASIRKTVFPKTGNFKESGAKTKFSCIAEADESTRQKN